MPRKSSISRGIRFPIETYRALAKLAKDNSRSYNDIVLQLVHKQLPKEINKSKVLIALGDK